MDFTWLVPLLALVTLFAVLVFALVSKRAVEERRHDPNVPTSTLATDGPQGGVALINPKAARVQESEAVRNRPDPVIE